MSLYNKLHGKKGKGSVPGELTAKEALGKEGSRQYFTSDSLINYLTSLRESEVEYLTNIVSDMKDRVRINDPGVTRSDATDRPYKFFDSNKINGRRGYKVILEAGMKVFFDDYLNGKFTIGFNLDELHEEALNS